MLQAADRAFAPANAIEAVHTAPGVTTGIGPHVDVVARVNGHAPGMSAVIFLRADGPLIGPRFAVQGKCLPSQKAEDRTQA